MRCGVNLDIQLSLPEKNRQVTKGQRPLEAASLLEKKKKKDVAERNVTQG